MAAAVRGRSTGERGGNGTVLETCRGRSRRRTNYAMMAQQLYENGQLHDTPGNVVAAIEMAASVTAAPVLLPPPPVRKSVHWREESVVSEVFEYDSVAVVGDRPQPLVKTALARLILLALVGIAVCAGPSAIIDTVIPSEMPFLPRGGDEQSIGGEPYEWWPSASTLALVPSHATAASTVVAIRTVIPSEMPSFFLPRGGIDEQSIGGEPYEWPLVPQNETATLVVVDPVVAVDTVIPSETPFRPSGGDERSSDGEPYRSMWWVASAIAYFVWSVMVGYWSWLCQAPITTVVATVVGLAVRRHWAERWAIARKERYVIRYRALVYNALYETHGPVAADALFARVSHQVFPSDQKKRQQLKAKVWKHIVRDATLDDRIQIEQVQGKSIWEWVDCVPPAGL